MKLFESYPAVFKDVLANPMILAKAAGLKGDSDFRLRIWEAHQANKSALCGILEKWKLDPNAFTICWARRWAAYKRPRLILYDVQRLIKIAGEIGPLQIILAGKAHPNDNLGRTYINDMLDSIDKISGSYDSLKIIALENYDILMARTLTSSVDVWLNNPLPPFEASGTSGMKAILNAVLQISTFDGWVAEAAEKNIGVIFGYRNKEGEVGSEADLHMNDDSQKLYTVLEEMVRLYYKTNQSGKVDLGSRWIDMMIDCVACSSHFNTYRMLDEYKKQIWNISDTYRLSVKALEIWTDVDGWLSADPSIVEKPILAERMSYEEASKLSAFGTNVLHPDAIRPAIVAGIPVRIRNTFHPRCLGTVIQEDIGATRGPLTGITSKPCSIVKTKALSSKAVEAPGYLVKLFSAFSRLGIAIELVSTDQNVVSSTIEPGVDCEKIGRLIKLLEKVASVSVEKGFSIIYLTGEGIRSYNRILGRTTSVMDKANITIRMLSLVDSAISIGFVVKEEDKDLAIRLLHKEFFEQSYNKHG